MIASRVRPPKTARYSRQPSTRTGVAHRAAPRAADEARRRRCAAATARPAGATLEVQTRAGGVARISLPARRSARPSWQISSVSIAISLFLALRPGPVHLHGQPRLKFQRITSCWFSSSRTTAALGALHLAVHAVEDPVPEREVADDAALERDVGELLQARNLAHGDVLAAVAVLDRRQISTSRPRHLGERALHGGAVVADAGDRRPRSCMPRRDRLETPVAWSLSSRYVGLRVARASSAGCGRSRTRPASPARCRSRQISRPLSMSSWVIVVRSHLTKNASSAVAPCSAPAAPDRGQEVRDRWRARAPTAARRWARTPPTACLRRSTPRRR